MRQSKVTSHGQVTIPKSIRDAIGLEEGDYVIFERVPEGILLRPKKVRLVDPDDTLSLEDQEGYSVVGSRSNSGSTWNGMIYGRSWRSE
ncbi:hypothetical protein CVV65_15715 [Kyrpidia spormannii]|uniref:SpoVT-AbrB domain-containing protein n=1 Tax=Kyrpidia spormannii TaxID=2055160 RepID=A0A2K8NA29_9BACL|nr:AbrB/MazE/SpoVT family DNA-binding domain-containing protein [Kyrpidia spormannii]ATY86198.1 hypothetical protein CVV65_15715 [Kyrpidia spormannii]